MDSNNLKLGSRKTVLLVVKFKQYEWNKHLLENTECFCAIEEWPPNRKTLVNKRNHYNTSKLQPQTQRPSWTLVCAPEYQFSIDLSSAHAPMSANETDGLCEWGLFEWSKLTCDLGFDGWKDCWFESVGREVNRGMNCRSNRLEECEQLSNPCVQLKPPE